MSTASPLQDNAVSSLSAYLLEQKVQKKYRALLFDGLSELFDLPPVDALDYLLETAFPKYFEGKKRDRCQILWQAEERVQHDIPEIISRLPLAPLAQLYGYLQENDLLQAIRYVWYELRPELRRLDPTPRYQDNTKQCKVAGLGKKKPLFGPPLVLTPPPAQRLLTPKPKACRLPTTPKLRNSRQLSLWPPAVGLLPFLRATVGA